jgi:hypothetical protein
MKKAFLLGSFCFALFTISCGNEAKTGEHVHEDGSVHSGHAPDNDTVKPAQQEFNAADTTTPHEHAEDGSHTHPHEETHSH